MIPLAGMWLSEAVFDNVACHKNMVLWMDPVHKNGIKCF